MASFWDKSVLSNVNAARLEQLLEALSRTNIKDSFLDFQKELILVERNPYYLARFSAEILPHFMTNYQSRQIHRPPFLPHHHLDRMAYLVEYINTSTEPAVRSVRARTKGPNSSVEKIARVYAEKGNIANQDFPGHLDVEDFYGLTFITSTLEQGYQAKQALMLNCEPFLQFEEEKDYYKGIRTKKSHHWENFPLKPYRAIHQTLRWQNSSDLNEILIHFQYMTLEDFEKNRNGDEENPERSHLSYDQAKLRKPHTLGNYQVVVLDYSGFPEGVSYLFFQPERVTFPPEVRTQKEEEELSYFLLRPA